MAMKFGKLDKFEGSDFRRWQKKMHFLLTTLKVVYVLTAPMPEYVEEETLEETRKRCKCVTTDNFRLDINALALSDRHPTYHKATSEQVKKDDPNITMEEYIRLEEEKTRRLAIVFNDTLTSEATLSCEPMVSSLHNNKIDFRILFDEFDDKDCTVYQYGVSWGMDKAY
ncbi:hypothetical protein Tco_0214281 [Tanacetum coccineum]